jgi:hypothetical protein
MLTRSVTQFTIRIDKEVGNSGRKLEGNLGKLGSIREK